MTDVVAALTPRHDSIIAATLEGARSLRVVRRCADVAELLSVVGAGIGGCAVLSCDLRALDLSLLARLRSAGLVVVGVHDAGDEQAERRLRQLGITVTVPADAPAADIERAIAEEAADASTPRVGIAPGGEPRLDADPTGDDDEGPGWRPAGAADGPDARRGLAPSGVDVEVEPGSVVAVWGPAGAPGRTTVAATLAAELASRGSSVLLVDADTYGGCVAQLLGLLDEAPGLAAATRAADQGSLDLPGLARLAPEALPGLRVLTGIPRADRWLEISGDALSRVLELARGIASTVVVDCGFCLEDDEELSYDTQAPRRNAATLTAVAAADQVVAVGAADAVSLQRFVRGLQELGTVPSRTPVAVVNRVRSSSVGGRPHESLLEVLHRFAGLETVHLLPEDRDAVDAALLAGRTVVEQAPDSPFRRAVAELATSLAPASLDRRAARAGRSWRRWRRGARRTITA